MLSQKLSVIIKGVHMPGFQSNAAYESSAANAICAGTPECSM
jgi:hypothetical protein